MSNWAFSGPCAPTASQDAETTEERIHSYAPSITYNSGQAEFNVSGVFRPRL
jgi:hypothetical protein